jgi:aspartate aminotransferase-like enzyme
MEDDPLLLTPGPVRVDPQVRQAMSAPMFSHRSVEFESVYKRARDDLRTVFEQSTLDGSTTSVGGTTLILNGTATMAMEAAVAHLVDPEDEIVALVNGKFGRRFARIADRYAQCRRVETDWGGSFDLDSVRATVDDDTAVVTMVHNETSTGVLNPVPAVGDIADQHDAWFVVDTVTSLGGDEFRIDDWGIDIVVTGSQKALAAPPGLSALYLANRTQEALEGGREPFYHDVNRHLEKAAANQTPYTSAVPLFRGLAVALEALSEEGLPARIRRHRRYAEAFREGFTEMGLNLFADPGSNSAYSNTVTAVDLPSAVQDRPSDFFDALEGRGVQVAGGQGHLDGTIFRVSNMGALSSEDIVRAVRAVGDAFEEVGVSLQTDAAVEVTQSILNR